MNLIYLSEILTLAIHFIIGIVGGVLITRDWSYENSVGNIKQLIFLVIFPSSLIILIGLLLKLIVLELSKILDKILCE